MNPDSEVNFGEVALPQRRTKKKQALFRARLQPCRNGLNLMGFRGCGKTQTFGRRNVLGSVNKGMRTADETQDDLFCTKTLEEL
ncbi:MAG: hypothetical protein ACLQPN_18845, partial [Bryobacteraceae bacterium]